MYRNRSEVKGNQQRLVTYSCLDNSVKIRTLYDLRNIHGNQVPEVIGTVLNLYVSLDSGRNKRKAGGFLL